MHEGKEQGDKVGKAVEGGKVQGGRGGVVREATKLSVKLLQKARTPSAAFCLPATTKQSEPSI